MIDRLKIDGHSDLDEMRGKRDINGGAGCLLSPHEVRVCLMPGFYSGRRERHWHFPHKPAIGLATLPLDRFVCLAAGSTIGSVTTRPFRLAGTRLEFNADARDGEVLVEVLNRTGQPINGFTRADCRPLRNVDGLRLSPTWTSRLPLGKLQGQSIRLKFYLRHAKLYAFGVVREAALGER